MKFLVLFCLIFSFWFKFYNLSLSEVFDIPSHRINCGKPDFDSIIYHKNSIKFKVDHNDIGKCKTDPKPWKNSKPWSERAEVVFKDILKKNKNHEINFDVKFLRGFDNRGRNETWFQIKCNATSTVPVMAFLDRSSKGYPFQLSLSAGSKHQEFLKLANPLNKEIQLKKWYKASIKFNNRNKGIISVSLDGHYIIYNKKFKQIETCPDRYTLRIGIYRGGSRINTLSTSEMVIKNLSLNKKNEKKSILESLKKLDLDVYNLQSGLADLGLNPGPEDGQLRNKTRNAFIKSLNLVGHKFDGELGMNELLLLKSSYDVILDKFRSKNNRSHRFKATGKGDYSDHDWNEIFYDNAGMPDIHNLLWMRENENNFIRFILKDKDTGRALTDNKRRHSAPFWERAELKQRLSINEKKIYQIEFLVRFVNGFTGNRETFFQVHQYNDGCNGAGPTLMLKFSNNKLQLDYMNRNGGHLMRFSPISIDELLGKWQKFRIIYDNNSYKANIYINEKKLFNNIRFYPNQCGIPHIKFGIYRPGSDVLKLDTSIVDFDKFQINTIDNIN